MTDMSKNSDRTEADRILHDRISGELALKDQLPAQRLARKLRLSQTFQNTKAHMSSILEIGCGAGFAAEYLNGTYKTYTGIDHSDQLIAAASELHLASGVTFQVADISTYEPQTQFDSAFLIGVLHHLDDPVGGMRRISQFVRSGGYVLANEPQPGNPLIKWARALRKKTDDNYSSDQVEFTATQLAAVYQEAGLIDIKITPQGFFSTPFAEVTMPLQPIMAPLSKFACGLDRLIERLPGVMTWGKWLSWNFVVSGRAPLILDEVDFNEHYERRLNSPRLRSEV